MMMKTISQLIKQLDGDDEIAKKAASELINIGMPAVPAIIETISRKSVSIWDRKYSKLANRLRQVLLKIDDSDLIPVLIELLQNENNGLRQAAFESLVKSKDPRSLQPLVNALSSDLTDLRAIKALGELGDSQAIKPLLKLAGEILLNHHVALIIEGKPVNEEFYEYPLTLLPRIIIALAKLGNYELAHLAIPLSQYHAITCSSEEIDTRIMATRSLQYVVIPGMFAALQAALHDEDNEVRWEAVDGMFYLGVKEAISELIQCVEDESVDVVNNVLSRLYRLTGIWFDDGFRLEPVRVEELQLWWEQHQTDYESGVCYHLGKPLYLPDVIAMLKESDSQVVAIRELKIITGVDFGFNTYIDEPDIDEPDWEEISKMAEEWWELEGHQFEAGCLYKYGYKQDMASIF